MSLEQASITCPQTGSRADVLVGFGFNCYRYTAMVDGRPIDVLWSAPKFADGGERPSHSGIPLLFPYPGRLRGTTLSFGGHTYALEGNDGRGNAIHGYVLNRPWKVVERSASRIVGRFQASERDASILAQWPADFILSVSYEFASGSLRSTITIENPDDKPLPFGFGSHPYFRVPLGPNGSADACLVKVPVRKYWELVDMLPSGKLLPADGSRALAGGLKFADARLDDVFTDVELRNHRATAVIEDSANGRRLAVAFDDKFTQCVVYNPPHREAICIEPYTCLPDQFTMAERGVVARPQTLQPGERFECSYEIRVE